MVFAPPVLVAYTDAVPEPTDDKEAFTPLNVPVVPLIVLGVVAPMGVELIEPPVIATAEVACAKDAFSVSSSFNAA